MNDYLQFVCSFPLFIRTILEIKCNIKGLFQTNKQTKKNKLGLISFQKD